MKVSQFNKVWHKFLKISMATLCAFIVFVSSICFSGCKNGEYFETGKEFYILFYKFTYHYSQALSYSEEDKKQNGAGFIVSKNGYYVCHSIANKSNKAYGFYIFKIEKSAKNVVNFVKSDEKLHFLIKTLQNYYEVFSCDEIWRNEINLNKNLRNCINLIENSNYYSADIFSGLIDSLKIALGGSDYKDFKTNQFKICYNILCCYNELIETIRI